MQVVLHMVVYKSQSCGYLSSSLLDLVLYVCNESGTVIPTQAPHSASYGVQSVPLAALDGLQHLSVQHRYGHVSRTIKSLVQPVWYVSVN